MVNTGHITYAMLDTRLPFRLSHTKVEPRDEALRHLMVKLVVLMTIFFQECHQYQGDESIDHSSLHVLLFV